MGIIGGGSDAGGNGERADVIVLTVIPAELAAARDALGIPEQGARTKDNDGTVYFHGAVRSALTSGPLRVVLACIGEAGNASAARAAASAIATWKPRAVLLMGIAAGIRGKVRIGEVVLSERVVAYEPAALVRDADGTRREEPRPAIERLPHAMAQDVMAYRPDTKRLTSAFERAGGSFPAPPQGQESVFGEHVARQIQARLATIASGEKLLRDPSKLLEVRKIHGKTEVGEMEGAGVVEACRPGNVPWLVIRGISDFGDDLKNDRFHDLASRAAAAVLVDFLEHGLELAASGATGGRGQPAERASFILGRPVDRDEDFAGRGRERTAILRAIELKQPVQILGEALMGKTSLLRWVERHVPLGSPVIRIDPTRGLTPVRLAVAVAGALGRPEAAEGLKRSGASAEDAAEVLDSLVPFVFLIDDADALATQGRGFDGGFFEVLRGLVGEGKLTWISASRRNLFTLFESRGLSSRFLNDAQKVWVGPLDEASARGLAGRGVSASDGERIFRYAGGFAYGLQWLGDRRSSGGGSIEDACDAFSNELAGVFQRWWGGMDARERALLKACAGVEGGVDAGGLEPSARRRLVGLMDRGLVAKRNEMFVVEGEAWRSFVRDDA